MTQHVSSRTTYYWTFLALLVLLGATVGAAYLPLGSFSPVVAMLIATTKAVLILLFFMHLRHGESFVRIVAVAGFLWLGILLTFTMADYLTRNWPNPPGP